VREALQRVSGLRDRLSQTSSRRGQLEQRTREITQEQAGIRENMGKLAQNSDLYVRYVKKLDQHSDPDFFVVIGAPSTVSWGNAGLRGLTSRRRKWCAFPSLLALFTCMATVCAERLPFGASRDTM
jgi:hypothetical protein